MYEKTVEPAITQVSARLRKANHKGSLPGTGLARLVSNYLKRISRGRIYCMRFLRHNTSSAIFLVYSELCSAYCGQTVCQKGHLATA